MSEGNGNGAAPPVNNGDGVNRWGRATLEQLAVNVMTQRSQLLQRMLDRRRDLDNDCHYPAVDQPVAVELMRQLYDREAVAARVVQLLPKECWQVSPLVYEDEDSDEPTAFEQAWDELGKDLVDGSSWFQDDKGSPVWEYLRRADILSGIGHFGVLLLGFDDGKDLQMPVDGVVAPATNGRRDSLVSNSEREALLGLPRLTEQERQIVTNDAWGQATTDQAKDSKGRGYGADAQYALPASQGMTSGTDQQYFGVQFGPSEKPSEKPATGKRKLLFLRAFDESLLQIVRYEWDVRNPRFGKPVMYRVTLNDPREQHSGVGLPLATVFVHWSRVIHLADNLGSSEVFGVPRMRPVLNRLLDLRKIYGGGAEGYWQACVPGLAYSTHPQLGGDVMVDEQQLKNTVENYTNTLQRFVAGVGGTWSTLAPTVPDPTGQVAVQVEALCVQLGVPVRVFKGSERGELASAQDDAAWNDRLRERQHSYLTPRVIVPFVDRLILAGVLPAPKGAKDIKGGSGKPKPPGKGPAAADAKPVGDKAAPAPAFGIKKQVPPAANAFPPKPGVPGAPGGAKPPGMPGAGGPPAPAAPPPIHFGKDALEDPEADKEAPAGYSIEWPDLDSLGDKDKAAIAQQQTAALAQYVSGGVEALLPPFDFLTRILGFTDEEAEGVIHAAATSQEEQQADHADLAAEQGLKPTPPPGFHDPDAPQPATVGMGEKMVDLKSGKQIISGHAPPAGLTVGHPAPPQQGPPGAKPPAPKPGVNVENFNPDQPRTDDGRFGSGPVTVTHGTTRETVDSILKEGLRGKMSGAIFPTSERGHVYLATDKELAKTAALYAAGKYQGETPAVIEVEIPAERTGSLKTDPRLAGSLMWKGDIPPEWIKTVYLKKSDGWKSSDGKVLNQVKGQTYYAPWVVSADRLAAGNDATPDLVVVANLEDVRAFANAYLGEEE